jgi:hypothetical protein
MTTPLPANDTTTRVAVVERQVDGMYQMFSRFEAAVEKIIETNSSVKEMLAVHEQRLQQQENGTRSFYELIERRKEEHDRGLEKVHQQLGNSVDELRKQLKEEIKEQYADMKSSVNSLREAQDTFAARIETKITNIQISSDEEFASLEERVRKLEAWRWVIAGGGVVIGFIAGNFSTVQKFFG